MKELPSNVTKYLAYQRGAHAEYLSPVSKALCKTRSELLLEQFSPEDTQALSEYGTAQTEHILKNQVIFEAKHAIRHRANKIASQGVIWLWDYQQAIVQ